MQRWTALAFAALFVAFVVGLVRWPGDLKKASPIPLGAASASASAPLDAGASDAGTATSRAGDGGDLGSGDVDPLTVLATGSDAGGTLLNGSVPPALPRDVPRSVVFGVILVQYKGAQGAPPTARSRDAALELAQKLAVDAKQDFKATVAKGDPGSGENLGRIPRGVLEPAPEYTLFSLPKDGVSDPVDTPKGFWIVRRIE